MRTTLRVLAVTSGPISFSKVRLAKSWRRNSVAERGGNLRQDLALGVEQEQSVRAALQNGIGQPIAGADQFLLLALVTFDGDEHGLDRVPNAAQREA